MPVLSGTKKSLSVYIYICGCWGWLNSCTIGGFDRWTPIEGPQEMNGACSILHSSNLPCGQTCWQLNGPDWARPFLLACSIRSVMIPQVRFKNRFHLPAADQPPLLDTEDPICEEQKKRLRLRKC